MVSETANDVESLAFSQQEIWEIVDQEARKYLGMDAETFIRLYRDGKLDDSIAAAMISEWVWLGGFAD